MMKQNKAVVLLSGGLDSTTVLAIANASGYETYALSFSYGQRHSWELECARKVAANSGVKDHRIAQIDLRVFGGSALTADISVPKGRSLEEMSEKIPVNLCARTKHHFPVICLGLGRGARIQRHLHRRERARLQRISRLPTCIHRSL